MSIAVRASTIIDIVETLEGEFVSAENDSVRTNGMNSLADLTASTTPPVTKYSAGQVALSSGLGSIDLTSLPNSNGTAGAVTFSGLKVQRAKLRNPSSNANAITITEGASNGHPLLGASFSVILQPGQSVTFENEEVDVGTDVASGDRIWDLAGTGQQALDFTLVAG